MSNVTELGIYRMFDDVKKPSFGTSGSACFDICAYSPERQFILCKKGEVTLVSTGIIFDIPAGYSVRLHPRSGISIKHGITLINAEGVIDSDYVNEVKVPIINHGSSDFNIVHGMRICQAELVRDIPMVTREIYSAPGQKTDRTGGFGSTGSI